MSSHIRFKSLTHFSLDVCRNAHVASFMRFSANPKSLEFHSAYNAHQIDKILNAVNTHSETELISFNISKQRVKRIEMWKQKHGKFESIEGILEVDGFGVKVLERFCDSILKAPEGIEAKAEKVESKVDPGTVAKKQQFVQPSLLESSRKKVQSCVSFHLDLNFIAWAKLSLGAEGDAIRPIHLEEWKCFRIGNEDKKLSLSDLIQILIFLNDKIPHADAYVVEAQQTAQPAKQPGSPVQVNINVQKSQFLAMLSILMVARGSMHVDDSFPISNELDENEELEKIFNEKDDLKPTKHQQKIFFLKTFLASRLYKTYIGSERVSTDSAVENILRYNYSKNQPDAHTFSSVNVPIKLREMFAQSDKLNREYMGQSLLIGLTFFKLCVLKCVQSTAILSNLRKRN